MFLNFWRSPEMRSTKKYAHITKKLILFSIISVIFTFVTSLSPIFAYCCPNSQLNWKWLACHSSIATETLNLLLRTLQRLTTRGLTFHSLNTILRLAHPFTTTATTSRRQESLCRTLHTPDGFCTGSSAKTDHQNAFQHHFMSIGRHTHTS